MFRPHTLSVFLAALLALCAATGAFAALEDQIRARLQAPAAVCEVGQKCAEGLTLPGVAGGPATGEEAYTTFCAACHATGLNNAPAFGNAEAWAPRIAKGMDVLHESALNGFNNGAMPPKGTCMACSSDILNAAVDYMVQAAK
ncbi:MAG: c-type cytochrome [Pseudomonadales bacterium]|nr:c-type cytochrome [Pseudomonadales bacterium]